MRVPRERQVNVQPLHQRREILRVMAEQQLEPVPRRHGLQERLFCVHLRANGRHSRHFPRAADSAEGDAAEVQKAVVQYGHVAFLHQRKVFRDVGQQALVVAEVVERGGDARREVEEARGVAPSVAAVAVDEVAADENRVAAPHERKRLIRIAVMEIRGKCEC